MNKTVIGNLAGLIVILYAVSSFQFRKNNHEFRTLHAHEWEVDCVAFSRDGKRLATGGKDKYLKVWDVSFGKLLYSHEHAYFVESVVFSPDDQTLASLSQVYDPEIGEQVQFWDAKSGRFLEKFFWEANSACRIAYSPDGCRLAVGGGTGSHIDKEVELAKVFDVKTKREALSIKGPPKWINDLVFSADRKLLAIAHEKNLIYIYDAQTGREILNFKAQTEHIWSLAFTPDSKLLASGNQENVVKIWEVSTGAELRSIHGQTDFVFCVAFSPDGKRLASGSGTRSTDNNWLFTRGEVKIWETETGKELLTLHGHSKAVKCIAFSPDGKRLASGSQDGTVIIWNVPE